MRLRALMLGLVLMPVPADARVPAAVRSFAGNRDRCDHLRGEEPYDAARARELADGMARYCRGTDAALARLKRTYRRDKAAMRLLSRYESTVE